MTANQPILSARSVSVSYRVPNRRFGSLKEFVVAKVRRETLSATEFHALDDVTVEAFPSECVGLLGHNGSGKSTLLKVIAGILKPRLGLVEVTGRLTSLIELGAGFDPELPAVDNIRLSCTLMGIRRREIDACLNDIIKFAELEKFTEFPLKNYSSGMYARLGFACATTINPDVILVDEVIGVGDEAFQRKCHARLNDLRGNGKAIVLVSHDMNAVAKFCTRVYCLDHGRVVFEGPTEEGIRQYRSYLGLTGSLV
jgi:ABC-type polysaccharide/polyol phosphate transport system ATPase subunit